MTREEMKIIEKIIEDLNITHLHNLSTLMPKIEIFLLYVIALKLDEMNHKILRILQEVD